MEDEELRVGGMPESLGDGPVLRAETGEREQRREHRRDQTG
jgi:hypothetical protein